MCKASGIEVLLCIITLVLKDPLQRILDLRIRYGMAMEKKSREKATPKRLIFYRGMSQNVS